MQDPIFLYTENLFAYPSLKNTFKRLLGKDSRGPQAVVTSLTSGLKQLGRDFVLNKKPQAPVLAACVLSGVKTLAWAIGQKRAGKVKRIIAGPNLVVKPTDSGGMLQNPLIDVIIVPSAWVKDYYSKIDPSLESKIKIWPAGVELAPLAQDLKTLDFLVYNKSGSDPMVDEISKILRQNNFSYQVLNYGKFKQQDYFNLLAKCKYEIYLSKSESQGLAMFEAWARGVPTLVWESGKFSKDGVDVLGKISAPFLNSQSGLAFSCPQEFDAKLQEFVKTSFAPWKYIEQNFSNKVTAEKYLEIAGQI